MDRRALSWELLSVIGAAAEEERLMPMEEEEGRLLQKLASDSRLFCQGSAAVGVGMGGGSFARRRPVAPLMFGDVVGGFLSLPYCFSTNFFPACLILLVLYGIQDFNSSSN